MERSTKLATGLATVAAAVSGSGMLSNNTAAAAVVSSGIVNIPITGNFNGLYLNLVTGATNNGTGTGGTNGGGSTAPGWDINPYISGTAWRLFAASTNNTGGGIIVTSATDPTELAAGFVVGPGPTYSTSASLVPDTGATVTYGVRFYNEATLAQHYGYFTINLNPTVANGGTLVSYAYESTANTAISVVPEPTSLGLLAAGSLGLLRRRNKVA